MKYVVPVFFLLFLTVSFTQAEIVRIQTPGGQEGLGWMFGARDAGENLQCWIATPAHVVLHPESHQMQKFTYVDELGGQGETDTPFSQFTDENGKQPKGQKDLAFAKVLIGRKGNKCLSRFPSQNMFPSVLNESTTFHVHQMFKTSSGTFNARLSRKKVDTFGGSMLEFESDDPKAKQLMLKGLSGATVTTESGGKSEPVAMVQQIDPATGTIRALQYDYIRSVFEKHMPTSAQAKVKNATFTIESVDYEPVIPGDVGVSKLPVGNTCWKANAGKQLPRTANLVISITDPKANVVGIEALQTKACGAEPVKFWVSQRTSDDVDWMYLGEGVAGILSSKPCRVTQSAARKFLLRFDTRNGPAAVATLKVYTKNK